MRLQLFQEVILVEILEEVESWLVTGDEFGFWIC